MYIGHGVLFQARIVVALGADISKLPVGGRPAGTSVSQ